MNANIWVHNLDPYLVRFSESMGLRWYGLAYLGGFLAGLALIAFASRSGRGPRLSTQDLFDLLGAVVFGTLIGGRLGYALLYAPALFTEFKSEFPYWGLLHVWEGGMASHGGIIGATLGCVFFATLRRHHWLELADLMTLGGSVGIFLGRCANFVNGELFGRPAPPGFPFAVKFPKEVFLWLQNDLGPASFRLETARAGAAVRTLKTIDLKDWETALESIPAAPAVEKLREILSEVIRAIQSGQHETTAALASELTPRYPSQLLEALLEGAVPLAIIVVFWQRPRQPGVVASLWLALYCAARIVSEEFRLPDPHLGFGLWGLTRGQWLSLAFLLAGLISLVICQRRATGASGGWKSQN